MRDDQSINDRRLMQQIRPAAVGKSTYALSGGAVSVTEEVPDYIIDDEGNVRRRWTPGDPWTTDYYFG